ncbi:MAG: MCE family protein [Mycobacterium sp.]
MRTLESGNLVRTGLLGVILTLLVIGIGQSFTSVPMLFATPAYFGQFTDSGGINVGDDVRIAGVDVGTVQSMEIEGDHVLMGFTLGTNQIGTDSRLAIRTDTILGRKVLEIEPRGTDVLRANGILPVGQSTTPYQIYDAFFDVTKAASEWDITTVKRSLDVLSETVNETSPNLSAALEGVSDFSETTAKRDEELKELLANANLVAEVLGDRSGQIRQLLLGSQTLLSALNERSSAVDYLLENVQAVSVQFEGLIDDNPNLNRVLEQLRTISDLLVKHKYDFADLLGTVRNYAASLAEAVGSGPYFKALLVNLVPGQLLQPFIDAAFRNRGIDPQKFWGDAGLPAFQFPDPSGTRLPNGAPPPAPTVIEGPGLGPAVEVGAPCSYTPDPANLPTPQNPLPCAEAVDGPFGPVPEGPYPAPTNVLTSEPDPEGLPPQPGVTQAAVPGEPVPVVPGTPVPIPDLPANDTQSVPLSPELQIAPPDPGTGG